MVELLIIVFCCSLGGVLLGAGVTHVLLEWLRLRRLRGGSIPSSAIAKAYREEWRQ